MRSLDQLLQVRASQWLTAGQVHMENPQAGGLLKHSYPFLGCEFRLRPNHL